MKYSSLKRKCKIDLSKVGFNTKKGATSTPAVVAKPPPPPVLKSIPQTSAERIAAAQSLVAQKLAAQNTPKSVYVTAAERKQKQLEEAKRIIETPTSQAEMLRAATVEPEYVEVERPEGEITLPDWMEEVIKYRFDSYRLINMAESKEKKERKAELEAKIGEQIPVFGSIELLPFQRIALPLVFSLMAKQRWNSMAIMPTGSGKSYIMAYTIKCMRRYGLWDKKDTVLIVTKPSIVMQIQRVIVNESKVSNVFVTSYPQMTRASIAELYFDWETKIVDDEATLVPVWNPWTKPKYAFFDESQSLKNHTSTQARVIEHFHSPCIDADTGEVIKERPVSMFMSATPYSKPLHVRYAAIALRPMVSYSYAKKRLKPDGFPMWIKNICQSCRPPVMPDEFSAQAMRKIQIELEPYTIRLDKVHFKRRTIIKQEVIEFLSNEERGQYALAMQEYLEASAAANKPEITNPQVLKLVAILKLRQKSELIRAPRLSDKALDFILEGKSVIIACAFTDTLDVCLAQLIAAGLTEDKIATIRGGQTPKLRQKNIDRFQRDEAHVMLMMFSAGGAGLSLHQYDAVNKRPRVVLLPPVWNAEELVQVLGRAHRVNSDSTTYQYIMWYAGTIEEEVSDRVRKKCSSLKAVVGNRDDWSKAFTGEEIGGIFRDKTEEEIEDGDDDDEMQIEFSLPVSVEDSDEVSEILAITS